jgi:PAS domain-containing protein
MTPSDSIPINSHSLCAQRRIDFSEAPGKRSRCYSSPAIFVPPFPDSLSSLSKSSMESTYPPSGESDFSPLTLSFHSPADMAFCTENECMTAAGSKFEGKFLPLLERALSLNQTPPKAQSIPRSKSLPLLFEEPTSTEKHSFLLQTTENLKQNLAAAVSESPSSSGSQEKNHGCLSEAELVGMQARILEDAIDVLFMVRFSLTDGKINWISPNCSRIIGWNSRELIGTTLYDHLDIDEDEKSLIRNKFLIDRGAQVTFRHKLSPSGVHIKMLSSSKTYTDSERSNESCLAACISLEDQYKMKQAQSEAKLAKQRESEVLDRLNKMSHEIRNDLVGVVSMADLLEESEGNQENV